MEAEANAPVEAALRIDKDAFGQHDPHVKGHEVYFLSRLAESVPLGWAAEAAGQSLADAIDMFRQYHPDTDILMHVKPKDTSDEDAGAVLKFSINVLRRTHTSVFVCLIPENPNENNPVVGGITLEEAIARAQTTPEYLSRRFAIMIPAESM